MYCPIVGSMLFTQPAAPSFLTLSMNLAFGYISTRSPRNHSPGKSADDEQPLKSCRKMARRASVSFFSSVMDQLHGIGVQYAAIHVHALPNFELVFESVFKDEVAQRGRPVAMTSRSGLGSGSLALDCTTPLDINRLSKILIVCCGRTDSVRPRLTRSSTYIFNLMGPLRHQSGLHTDVCRQFNGACQLAIS